MRLVLVLLLEDGKRNVRSDAVAPVSPRRSRSTKDLAHKGRSCPRSCPTWCGPPPPPPPALPTPRRLEARRPNIRVLLLFRSTAAVDGGEVDDAT